MQDGPLMKSRLQHFSPFSSLVVRAGRGQNAPSSRVEQGNERMLCSAAFFMLLCPQQGVKLPASHLGTRALCSALLCFAFFFVCPRAGEKTHLPRTLGTRE